MSERLVIDTNVLVDHFRKLPAAIDFISKLVRRPVISAITVGELFAGVREGKEREEIERFLSRTVVLDVDEQIAIRAGLMLRQFQKSHAVGLADALIAATADAEGARIVTLNTKHFPMFNDVLVPYQKA